MMKKLVCRQVAPENQGEWLIDDLKGMEGFAIYGNRDFIDIDRLNTYGLFDESRMTGLEALLEDFENIMDYNEENPEEEFMESIEYYIDTELTDEKKIAIMDIIIESIESKSDIDYEEAIMKIIEVIDGRKLEVTMIHGCCQRDWQYMIYDTEMVDPQMVESYYFNKGSEWEVGYVKYEDNEEVDFETVELDDYQYTTEWSTVKIRKEFEECYGIDEKDVVMLEFDGYIKTPKYTAL